MARNSFLVFDSDMHVHEPHDLYLKYMDPKWGDRIPRAEPRTHYSFHFFRDANGQPIRKTRFLAELRSQGITALASRMASVAHKYDYALTHDFDAPSQVVAMDTEEIDVAVMFRTFPLITDDTLEPEYALALARAWNDWITDFCRCDPVRMKAAGLIPLHDVDMAVDEARRLKRLDHVGVCLTPEPHCGRHLHDTYFDPLWAELERLDLAATFHHSPHPNLESVTNRFPGHPNSTTLTKTFQNNLDEIMGLASLIIGGVLERFPRLRVAMLEGNCSWVPWLLYRMDEAWEQKGAWEETPLSLKPSEYFLRQCYVSVDADEYLVADVVRRIGDDNVVFSTDYPHNDSSYPEATSKLLRVMAAEGLSEKTMRKILWDNCAGLYSVPTPPAAFAHVQETTSSTRG